MEFLVLFRRGKEAANQIYNALRRIESSLNGDSYRRKRGVRLELSAMPTERFARLRPGIFNYELVAHGKLLWGDPDEIALPGWWRDERPIPVYDGFRLLNNRVAEQVAARAAIEEGTYSALEMTYAISKFWIELATSLSLFLDCYRATYRERQEALEERLFGRPDLFDAETAKLFVQRLKQAMAVKFADSLSEQHWEERAFAEAADMAARVWQWETRQLLADSQKIFAWQSVLPRLRRVEPLVTRLRDWARLLVRSDRRCYLRPAILKAALRAGSFANVVYAANCLIEFFWDSLACGDEVGVGIASSVGGWLGERAKCDAGGRRLLARGAVSAWEHHLRFAAA